MTSKRKMADGPLISVVVPAYNRSTTVAACVKSIQSQTYPHWEAIVVDDGSTDDTRETVAALARDDDRIRLVRLSQNRGAQAARNAGIRASRGAWITFLDSDDQYLPASLEARLTVAEREDVSVVHSECLVVRVDGRIEPYRVPPMAGWVYRDLLKEEGPVYQGLMTTRDALEKIGFLDERIIAFQEWDTAIRLARHYRFGFEASPTAIYDCRGMDTISKDLIRGARGYEQVFDKHYLAILRYGGPRTIARHYRIAAKWYQSAGAARDVRRCHLLALLWSLADIRMTFKRTRRVVRSVVARMLPFLARLGL